MKKILSVIMSFLFIVIMVIPSFAATTTTPYTPSVTPDHNLVIVTDIHGNLVVGIISDSNGTEVSGVASGYLKFVVVSGTNDTTLLSAYTEIKNTTTISGLNSNLGSYIPSNDNINNYVATDVFSLDLKGSYANDLNKSGNSLTVTFKTSVPKGATAYILMKDGSNWVTINPSLVKNNGDGTVSVTLPKAGCPLAVVVKNATATINTQEVAKANATIKSNKNTTKSNKTSSSKATTGSINTTTANSNNTTTTKSSKVNKEIKDKGVPLDSTSRSSKKNNKILWVIICVAAVLLISIIVYSLRKHKIKA